MSLIIIRLSSLEGLVSELKALSTLDCSQNLLESIDEIARLKHFPNLKNLDVSGNEVESLDNFRIEALILLPNLQVLNGIPVEPEEVAEAKAETDERAAAAEEAAAATAAQEEAEEEQEE